MICSLSSDRQRRTECLCHWLTAGPNRLVCDLEHNALCRNSHIFIGSAINIRKQCMQTASAAGDPLPDLSPRPCWESSIAEPLVPPQRPSYIYVGNGTRQRSILSYLFTCHVRIIIRDRFPTSLNLSNNTAINYILLAFQWLSIAYLSRLFNDPLWSYWQMQGKFIGKL